LNIFIVLILECRIIQIHATSCYYQKTGDSFLPITSFFFCVCVFFSILHFMWLAAREASIDTPHDTQSNSRTDRHSSQKFYYLFLVLPSVLCCAQFSKKKSSVKSHVNDSSANAFVLVHFPLQLPLAVLFQCAELPCTVMSMSKCMFVSVWICQV
jgi:hypothetical protein